MAIRDFPPGHEVKKQPKEIDAFAWLTSPRSVGGGPGLRRPQPCGEAQWTVPEGRAGNMEWQVASGTRDVDHSQCEPCVFTKGL